MAAIKISVIGAGSATFSMKLIRDLCLTKSLWGSKVTLMDIDKKRLDMIYDLATRYVSEIKADLKIEKTMERKDALEGADFVINTALVGGHDLAEVELEVGDKYGYFGVAEGDVRGVYNFLQLDFFMELAQDIEDICPDAWLINLANGPTQLEPCTLLTRKTKVKVIGLCHGHCGVYRVAQVIGINPKEVTFQAPGLNHCIWLTHFYYRGEDAYPLIDEWIEKKAEEYWKLPQEKQIPELTREAIEQYNFYGLLPIGDTPTRGGTRERWWIHKGVAGPGKPRPRVPGQRRMFPHLQKVIDEMFRLAANPSASLLEKFPPLKSREQVVPIIDAITNNSEGKFQVNIPNNGAIDGIADDVAVEIPALVSKRRVQGIRVGSLPKILMLFVIYPRILWMERYLEAFLSGDKRMLLGLLLLDDRRTKSVEQAKAYLEEILALPFNRKWAERFK